MNDEIIPNNLPLIRRRKGAVFVEPAGYVPDIRETPYGGPVDATRLYPIAAMILEEHEDSDRLKKLLLTCPDMPVELGELRGEMLYALWMDGEMVGLFEPGLLDVLNEREDA